ncbi:MAG: Eco29kI family restriction endonuclease [Verrucomicrobia bacterium]|nr:Eco29kI family restriction endonuclease [Verrucomicrobiota bacterium]
MKQEPFDRSKHVYRNDTLVELVKDAVRFFNGTPVHTLPPPEKFLGTGVYALYYTGKNPLYTKYAEINRLEYSAAIYVGKAVPKGWRQSRSSDNSSAQSNELFGRLREHSRNIKTVSASGLSLEDFRCRFVICEDTGSDMIGTIEAALIKLNRPLWNSSLDGFGNHTPGRGRFRQARSDWDVIHPGRAWAVKCKGQPRSQSDILKDIAAHVGSLPTKQ